MRLTLRIIAAATLAGVTLAGAGAAEDEAAEPGPAAAAILRVAVDAKSPPLLLRLFAGEDGVSAEVLDAATGRPLQDLDAGDAAEPAREAFAWLEDLNFDGRLDVALPAWTGATGNVGYAVWLWAPAAGRFERNALLSAASRLTVHAARRELTSHWNAGRAGGLYTNETIRCPDGVPTLVRREQVELEGELYVKTVEELRDGRLVRVARTTSPTGFPPEEAR